MVATMSAWKIFRWSVVCVILALVAAGLYGNQSGTGIVTAVALTFILGVFEVSLSFDNAVLNAKILTRMTKAWRKRFLTWGLAIAVFGMRFALPLLVVWGVAGIDPVRAFNLALHPPGHGAAYFPDGSPSYATILHEARPLILAFGLAFLAMLFWDWLNEPRDRSWLSWLERPMGVVGRFHELPFMERFKWARVIPTVITLSMVACGAAFIAHPGRELSVLLSGITGTASYLVIKYLGDKFEANKYASGVTQLVGRAALFSFLYLQVLDASMSLDGVIGAFAITSDPIIIVLGLGVIGALFIRSFSVFFVERGTLDGFVFLEHGAFWAIGALSMIMMVSLGDYEVPEVVTGLIGFGTIVASGISSIVHRRRHEQ